MRVVSLGDSYIAGNGNGNYYADQGPGAPNMGGPRVPAAGRNCWQSYSSYPWQLVTEINDSGGDAAIWHSACAGAEVADIRPQWEQHVPPDWKATADVVLISVGGNDLGFTNIVWHCLAGLPGGIGPVPPGTCDEDLDFASNGLAGVLAQIRAELEWLATRTPAHLVLVGYPDIADPAGLFSKCPTARGQASIRALVAQHEVELQDLVAGLGAELSSDRFHAVTVSDEFAGNGPCRFGGTLIHHIVDPGGPAQGESFHPSFDGARTYRDALWADGIQLLRAVPDSDGDGVPDDVDGCPSDPGPQPTGCPPGPVVHIVPLTIVEPPNTQTTKLLLTLTEPAPTTTTIRYTTNPGTATPGTDYTHTTDTITFNPGQTTATAPLTIHNDNTNEPDETLTITLTEPNGLTPGPTTTITITDNNATTSPIPGPPGRAAGPAEALPLPAPHPRTGPSAPLPDEGTDHATDPRRP